MTSIGTFMTTADGFEGCLCTLSLDIALTLVPAAESDGDNTPDYRILADEGENAYEVGAGWKRVGDKAGNYVAIVIDDPAFAAPLRANLFASDDGAHILVWSRPTRRKAKD